MKMNICPNEIKNTPSIDKRWRFVRVCHSQLHDISNHLGLPRIQRESGTEEYAKPTRKSSFFGSSIETRIRHLETCRCLVFKILRFLRRRHDRVRYHGFWRNLRSGERDRWMRNFVRGPVLEMGSRARTKLVFTQKDKRSEFHAMQDEAIDSRVIYN